MNPDNLLHDVLSMTFELSADEKWNELNRMRLSGEMCDVHLVANPIVDSGDDTKVAEPSSDSPTIPAHRLVLMASSPYFRAMFSSKKLQSIQLLLTTFLFGR